MIEEDGKRPPEDQIRDLIDSGIIDEKGRVFSERCWMLKTLLDKRGFVDIDVSHRGPAPGVPGGIVRLREIYGERRQGDGPYKKVQAIIEGARDLKDLWKSLATAGYYKKPRENGKKKPSKRAS